MALVDVNDSFDNLMELFDKCGLVRTEDCKEYGEDLTFSISGLRDSFAMFNLDKYGLVHIQLGKWDSDSGGIAFSEKVNGESLRGILHLCKRYLASGRRKVIRNYEKKDRREQ